VVPAVCRAVSQPVLASRISLDTGTLSWQVGLVMRRPGSKRLSERSYVGKVPMVGNVKSPARTTLALGVFLVALVTLMVELLLIRVFDVVLVQNIGYMIISCALFAFGLSGVYMTLRPLKDSSRIDRYLAMLSLLLALSRILQLPLLNAKSI
jgi:hypothetical protein